MGIENKVDFPIVLRMSRESRDELERRARDARMTPGEYLSPGIDAGFDPREPWERMDPKARAAFEGGGIRREDVNAAARGERPLPKSDSDKQIAANYDEGKRLQALPPTSIHPFDILAFDDDHEFRFTLKQLMTEAQLRKADDYWVTQPLDRLDAMERERRALFRERIEPAQRSRTTPS